jgi:hypothetical protein
VGDGVAVGLGVAVAAADRLGVVVATERVALGDDVKVTTRPGIASQATKITARSRPRTLILLG